MSFKIPVRRKTELLCDMKLIAGSIQRVLTIETWVWLASLKDLCSVAGWTLGRIETLLQSSLSASITLYSFKQPLGLQVVPETVGHMEVSSGDRGTRSAVGGTISRVGSSRPSTTVLDPIAALTTMLVALPTPLLLQAQQLTIPTFNWSTPDQTQEFSLSWCAFYIWFHINMTHKSCWCLTWLSLEPPRQGRSRVLWVMDPPRALMQSVFPRRKTLEHS